MHMHMLKSVKKRGRESGDILKSTFFPQVGFAALIQGVAAIIYCFQVRHACVHGCMHMRTHHVRKDLCTYLCCNAHCGMSILGQNGCCAQPHNQPLLRERRNSSYSSPCLVQSGDLKMGTPAEMVSALPPKVRTTRVQRDLAPPLHRCPPAFTQHEV
jgi:hypothetical protein